MLQPAQPITPSETHINVGCYGDATGSIDLSVTGGTPGYTYSWNIGATTQDIGNLPFGVYTVFITDANNCVGQFSVVVNQPAAPLTNSAVITPVACFNGSNGAINMGVSGGTPPYSYVWSNGATSGIISGLSTGNYSVNCNWSPVNGRSPSMLITPSSNVTGPEGGVVNPDIGIFNEFPGATFANPSKTVRFRMD